MKKIGQLFRILRLLKEIDSHHEKIKGLQKEFKCIIRQSVKVHHNPCCELKIGQDAVIEDGSILSIFNDPVGKGAESGLRIGTKTYIGENCNIRACGGIIQIGDQCLVGHDVSMIAANHSKAVGINTNEMPWDKNKSGIQIGNGVWIGCKAILLPGIKIGDHAVVAAGSVVTKDVPNGGTVAGVPAKQI